MLIVNELVIQYILIFNKCFTDILLQVYRCLLSILYTHSVICFQNVLDHRSTGTSFLGINGKFRSPASFYDILCEHQVSMPIILFLLKVYIKEYVFLDENVVCKLKVIFVNIMFLIII